jgi:hypothetical protein
MGIGRGFIANVASRADFTTDNTIDKYWEMAAQPLCIGSWIMLVPNGIDKYFLRVSSVFGWWIG